MANITNAPTCFRLGSEEFLLVIDPRKITDDPELQAALNRGLYDVKNLVNGQEGFDRQVLREMLRSYYKYQEDRIAGDAKLRDLVDAEGKPLAGIDMLRLTTDTARLMEKKLQAMLATYATRHPMGLWALSIRGIGPVIAAGLLAMFDFSARREDGSYYLTTAGSLWSFSGLVPGKDTRKRGERRPYCAEAKQLAFHIGSSFVKLCNDPKSVYGRLYKERLEYERKRNEEGYNAQYAANALATKAYGKETESYKAMIKGMLSDSHLKARARRYAAKMFLSHYFEVAYILQHGQQPPKPFAIAHMDHVHQVMPEGGYPKIGATLVATFAKSDDPWQLADIMEEAVADQKEAMAELGRSTPAAAGDILDKEARQKVHVKMERLQAQVNKPTASSVRAMDAFIGSDPDYSKVVDPFEELPPVRGRQPQWRADQKARIEMLNSLRRMNPRLSSLVDRHNVLEDEQALFAFLGKKQDLDVFKYDGYLYVLHGGAAYCVSTLDPARETKTRLLTRFVATRRDIA